MSRESLDYEKESRVYKVGKEMEVYTIIKFTKNNCSDKAYSKIKYNKVS